MRTVGSHEGLRTSPHCQDLGCLWKSVAVCPYCSWVVFSFFAEEHGCPVVPNEYLLNYVGFSTVDLGHRSYLHFCPTTGASRRRVVVGLLPSDDGIHLVASGPLQRKQIECF